jgi:hypothetical protein
VQEGVINHSIDLEDPELAAYNELTNVLAFLVKDGWMFKACMLLTLSLPSRSRDRFYKILFGRKL